MDSTKSWPLAKNLGRAALGAGTTWWHAGTSAPSFGAGGCEAHGGTVARWHGPRRHTTTSTPIAVGQLGLVHEPLHFAGFVVLGMDSP